MDTSIQQTRQDEVILTRLRIGHTRMTHGYLMNTPDEDRPECDICNTDLTIAHIFTDCKKYERERIQHFGRRTMKEILEESDNFSMRKIANFLRKTNLYDTI